MSNCAASEQSKGILVADVTGLDKPVNNGTKVSFGVITVFNETDQDILVSYKNTAAEDANFYVPKDGRSFTRVINQGLMNGSIRIKTTGAEATGHVIINLGN
jgi:hypothetical protein